MIVRDIPVIESDDIRICEFGLGDIESLLSLRMEVLSNVFAKEKRELSEKEWEDIRNENREYYQEEIASGRHIACGIYVRGSLAGCGGVCIYREMPSPDNRSGRCAYLMNIYVRDEYRRQGLARKVVSYLIGRAKDSGCDKVYLETSDMARNLYSIMGFEDMHGYMKLNSI